MTHAPHDHYDLAQELCNEVGLGIVAATETILEYADASGRMDASLVAALQNELWYLSHRVEELADEVGAMAHATVDSVAHEGGGGLLRIPAARLVWKTGGWLKNDYDADVRLARRAAGSPASPEEADALDRADSAGYLMALSTTAGQTLLERWRARCFDAGRPSVAIQVGASVDGLSMGRIEYTPDPGLLSDPNRYVEAAALGERVSDLLRLSAGGVTNLSNTLTTRAIPTEGAVVVAERLIAIAVEARLAAPARR